MSTDSFINYYTQHINSNNHLTYLSKIILSSLLMNILCISTGYNIIKAKKKKLKHESYYYYRYKMEKSIVGHKLNVVLDSSPH